MLTAAGYSLQITHVSRIAICSSIPYCAFYWKGWSMTYFKLNTIIACSVSICMAATGPSLSPRASDDKKIGERETLLPGPDSPLYRGLPEKAPTPPKENQDPVRDDPADSPAGSDDKKDCDECVLVRADGPDAAMGARSKGKTDSGPGIPLGLASTLWGLFCVGKPRGFPKTRVSGMTLP